MRIVYQSEPVAAVERAPDGRTTAGRAFAIARVYEPDDSNAGPGAQPVAQWLLHGKLSATGALLNPPPPTIVGPSPVEIPLAILQALRPDQLLTVGWQITYGAHT